MKTGIAVATLMGTIIGAGVLGIPYVVAKAGLIAGLINLIGIGLLLVVLNLYIGEVSLRTKGHHQLTGYAEKYLGKKGKMILMFSMMIEIYGALTAYMIGEGITFASIFGGSAFIYSILFFAVGSFLIYKGLKTVGKSEYAMMIFSVCAILLISILAVPHITSSNYANGNGNIFIPYGVILFAYLGITSVPLLKEELAQNKKKVKTAIILGSVIPIIIYTVFTLCVVGMIGINGFNSLETGERMASAALNRLFDGFIGMFANIFAMLAMGTSFLALGTALLHMYTYDYNVKKMKAWLLTLVIPLMIFVVNYFTDMTNFFQILGVTGAVAGGITGNLIVIMFHKAKKHGNRKPEFSIKIHWLLSILLMIIFTAGIIYSLAMI